MRLSDQRARFQSGASWVSKRDGGSEGVALTTTTSRTTHVGAHIYYGRVASSVGEVEGDPRVLLATLPLLEYWDG